MKYRIVVFEQEAGDKEIYTQMVDYVNFADLAALINKPSPKRVYKPRAKKEAKEA